jgi:hypothetical protein
MTFAANLLQALSVKQLHKVPLGLMRRTDFVEIVCELVFPLKLNHQLSHLSQESDGLRLRFVVLPIQPGLDLPLVDRQRIFRMLLIALGDKPKGSEKMKFERITAGLDEPLFTPLGFQNINISHLPQACMHPSHQGRSRLEVNSGLPVVAAV